MRDLDFAAVKDEDKDVQYWTSLRAHREVTIGTNNRRGSGFQIQIYNHCLHVVKEHITSILLS